MTPEQMCIELVKLQKQLSVMRLRKLEEFSASSGMTFSAIANARRYVTDTNHYNHESASELLDMAELVVDRWRSA
jgi:hypothetical protein